MRQHTSHIPRWLAAFVVSAAVIAVPAATARAHTDLDYTVPVDGAAVGAPVSEITVAFTEAVTLVGPGFEVLDPQGNIVTPFAVTDDSTVFRLQLDPPIGGGEAAVRYEVRAEDGHTISGGFTFTISVDAPTTTTTTTTTSTTTIAAQTSTAEPQPTDARAEATTSQASPPTEASTDAAATTAPRADDVASGEAKADDDDGSGFSGGVAIAITLAVAFGAGAFLLVRARAARPV